MTSKHAPRFSIDNITVPLVRYCCSQLIALPINWYVGGKIKLSSNMMIETAILCTVLFNLR